MTDPSESDSSSSSTPSSSASSRSSAAPSSPVDLVATTRLIVEKLQLGGENVLMNHLLESKGAGERTVARILDVLFALNVAKVEDQRGREARSSRAYAYRSGYALARPMPIHEMRERVRQLEARVEAQPSSARKRVKTR
jgi:hypothetical protein